MDVPILRSKIGGVAVECGASGDGPRNHPSFACVHSNMYLRKSQGVARDECVSAVSYLVSLVSIFQLL